MSIENIKNRLPEYAKDLKLNVSSFMNDTAGLSEQQLWGTLVVSAIASRNDFVLKEINDEAENHLSGEAMQAAKAAAAIMSMNNVYYRFLHLASEKQYKTMPAKLRMQVIGKPGVDKIDFEMWSLAVSVINACGSCIDSHEKELSSKGVSKEMIQQLVRIASVIHAVAVTLETEQTLAE